MNMGRIISLAAVVAGGSLLAQAGGIRYTNEEGQFLEMGGRIQVQYRRIDLTDEPTLDRLFFRRLRPYFMGSIYTQMQYVF